MACCLLHNFIRQEMPVDPFETQDESDQGTGDLGEAEDNVHSIGTSNEWTDFRNNLAQTLKNSNDAFDEAMEVSHDARTNMSGVGEISSLRSRKRKSIGSVSSLAEVVSEELNYLEIKLKIHQPK
ncbi:hypothetical protein Tco_0480532 [Tanacetum coccineum]